MKKVSSRSLFKALVGLLLAGLILANLILAGCASVGPKYVRPEIKMPRDWAAQTSVKAMSPADRKALDQWWTLLGDPLLTSLIDRAMADNLSLKEALARVREARSRRRSAQAAKLPAATASGSAAVGQKGHDSWKFTTTESYSAGLDVSWEADLFGGTGREIEAARADFQAALEDLRDVMVSLTAETATAYVKLRTYQSRLETARENLRLQKETLELTRIKYQTGLAGALDVEQAAYNLESTRSQVPDLEAGMEEMKNRLAVLLGSWPGELSRELSTAGPIPQGALEAAIGLPADLLRRRPDIRAAERRLAAQTARVGAAQSGLYPKLSLSGSLGLEALTLSGLFSPAAMAAVLGAGISWKVFNLEEVRAEIEVQGSLQEQALIQYEAALRTAVEEVENALTGLIKEARKQEALAKGVEAAKEAARLALQEYETGLSDFQNVLSTQQSLTSFNDQLAQSQGQATLNLITLYKALGGGWSNDRLAKISVVEAGPGLEVVRRGK